MTKLPARPRGRPKGSLNSKPRARSAMQAVALAQPIGVRAKCQATLQTSLACPRTSFSPTSHPNLLERAANTAGIAEALALYSCNKNNACQAIPPTSLLSSSPAVPAPQQEFLFKSSTDRLEPTIASVENDDPFNADWQYW